MTWLPPFPQLELKKTLLDRMVHLLSRGYVLPVVGYIRKCLEKLNTDISLIRYFVTEVKQGLIYFGKSCIFKSKETTTLMYTSVATSAGWLTCHICYS